MTARGKVMLLKIEAVQEYILSGVYEADAASDALRMLGELYKAIAEEQEPVTPIPYQQETSIGFFAGFKCGACNAVVFPDYRFCPKCGKAVKWDAPD